MVEGKFNTPIKAFKTFNGHDLAFVIVNTPRTFQGLGTDPKVKDKLTDVLKFLKRSKRRQLIIRRKSGLHKLPYYPRQHFSCRVHPK
jgi:hypothetical protein